MENNETLYNGMSAADYYSKMFENYNKSHENGNKKKLSREELLAKYFVPRKEKETFRGLPPQKGEEFFQVAYFHQVTTNAPISSKYPKGKRYRKLYCPKYNDPKVEKLDKNGNVVLDSKERPVMVDAHCPLCAKYEEELKKQDSSLKGIKKDEMNEAQLRIKETNDKIWKNAVQYQAKKFYVVKGIDKGAEKDGPKFWRFKYNTKKVGVHDKLIPAIGSFVETYNSLFFDPERGCDFTVTVVDNNFPGSNRTYKDVSSIFPKPPSKLHSDPVLAEEWLKDKTTWREVFKPASAPNITSEEYLEMVSRGSDPYWDDSDSSNKRWVFPGRPDLEELANNRDRNLDADDNSSDDEEMTNEQSISNVNESQVGTFKDDAVDLSKSIKQPKIETETLHNSTTEDYDLNSEIDDLPF